MHTNYSIKQLPSTERPRERLLLHGPDSLSNCELLAIILGSGTKGKSVLALAQELLVHFESLNQLRDASIEDLCQVKGLGKAKAMQLKAALSLVPRLNREKFPLKEKLTTPVNVFLWVRDFIVHEKKEVFGVILLDAKGGVLRWEVISVGTLTRAIIHPREVFYPAIRYLAASLILVHNHPSGDPTPSVEDRQLTRNLLAASRFVAIPILDHIIVGKSGFISLKENGFLFNNTSQAFTI